MSNVDEIRALVEEVLRDYDNASHFYPSTEHAAVDSEIAEYRARLNAILSEQAAPGPPSVAELDRTVRMVTAGQPDFILARPQALNDMLNVASCDRRCLFRKRREVEWFDVPPKEGE